MRPDENGLVHSHAQFRHQLRSRRVDAAAGHGFHGVLDEVVVVDRMAGDDGGATAVLEQATIVDVVKKVEGELLEGM